MARNQQSILPEPEYLHATEVFPELSEEIDRRILHSEQRIKFWVLGGILTNLMVAVGAAIPLVFYLGQISRDINASLTTLATHQVALDKRGDWMNDRMLWEARIEAQLESQGVHIVRQRPSQEDGK